MKRVLPVILILLFAAVAMAQHKMPQTFPIGGSAPSGAKLRVVPDLQERVAQFKTVQMPFRSKGLSPKEVQLVNKLVEASHAIESIYWRQADPDGLTLYQQLKGSRDARDQMILRYLAVNGGRFDLIRNNEPFIIGATYQPGGALYPHGLTREDIDAYIAKNPEKKEALYSPYTVIRRQGGELEAIPYHDAYRLYILAATKALREAASLSDDKSFAEFLNARADALLTDDYYKSDLMWLDLKNPKFDIIFAPYETYLDNVLGVKRSYGAAVLIRNEAESKKLDVYQATVPKLQQVLPLSDEDKPSKVGQFMPMEVMDAPFRSGDMTHGYQAVADNLPNDARIHQEKGTKKIFFKNFMDARVDNVLLPLAKRLMLPEQAKKASADGYLTYTLMHEISHGLGPAYARTPEGKKDIREAIGSTFSALEEAKADVTGMFTIRWLAENGVLPKARLEEYYASYFADLFRSVRFGVAEAHGRAVIMQFNYLVDQGAIVKARPLKSGKTLQQRYVANYARMPEALESLTKELLAIEATGDRKRAEAWFAKYDKMPEDLKSALASVKDVPVDVYPVFSFPEVLK